MKKTILIIANAATRTGASVLLLDILSWIKNESKLKFVIVFEHEGELINDFRNLGEVFVWNCIPFSEVHNNKTWLIKVFKTITARLYLKFAWWFPLFFIRFKHDVNLIFSNTAVNGHLLSMVKKIFIRQKIITYVHEGKYLLELYNKDSWVSFNIECSDLLITVSRYVKELLVNQYGFQRPIKIIPGAINPCRLKQSKHIVSTGKFDIDKNSKILLSCGSLAWHKGIDAFMQLARKISQIDKKIKLIWLGGSKDDEAYFNLLFDIEKLNLQNTVKIIPSQPNSFEYFAMTDIFLMLSRDESFSLVTVEAGLAKKPVLCFEGSGGPTEIIDNDPRFLVPYLDIDFLSKRICELLDDPDEMKSMGQFLYNRTIDNYVINKTASKILEEFNKFFT